MPPNFVKSYFNIVKVNLIAKVIAFNGIPGYTDHHQMAVTMYARWEEHDGQDFGGSPCISHDGRSRC